MEQSRKTVSAPPSVDIAPEWTLPIHDDKAHSFEEHSGRKVVFVNDSVKARKIRCIGQHQRQRGANQTLAALGWIRGDGDARMSATCVDAQVDRGIAIYIDNIQAARI